VHLLRMDEGVWRLVGNGVTDADGRVSDLTADEPLEAGDYRIEFAIAEYFSSRGIETFYPSASVTFTVLDTSQHYHVPLLLSPFGYSTYRGS
jgi:5-hydroxyisourate hydrolase